MPSPSNQWYRPGGSYFGLDPFRTNAPARSSGSSPTTSQSAVISVSIGANGPSRYGLVTRSGRSLTAVIDAPRLARPGEYRRVSPGGTTRADPSPAARP